MADEHPTQDPGRVVAVAYLLAAICLLVPLAVLGAVFAGVVLLRRGRPEAGLGVVVLAVACTGVGMTLLP